TTLLTSALLGAAREARRRAKLQSGYLERNIQGTRHHHARPRLEVEKRFNAEEFRSWKRLKHLGKTKSTDTWLRRKGELRGPHRHTRRAKNTIISPASI